MDFSLILLFINTHLVFDFICQSKRTIELRFSEKYNKANVIKSIKGNLIHVLTHLFGSLVIIGIFYEISGGLIPLIQILLIGVTHLIIDQLKSILIMRKICLQEDIGLFLGDQFLHLAVILLICSKGDLHSLKTVSNYSFSNIDKVLLIVLVIILSTFVAGVFIKIFMKFLETSRYKKLIKKNVYLPNDKRSILGARNGGFIIGILERVFILIIMIINQPSMIGFVLATKSVARFKKLEDESFAEYFIIGSFMSFIIAILGGFIIAKLLNSIS